MSETAQTPLRKASEPGPDPVVVLVRPQMGENIGAAARAMLNFGLSQMRLVAPRDGWPNPAAVAMASGAGRVLDAAQVQSDLAGAVADCHHVYATTARVRGLTKRVITPSEAMAEARALQAQGQRVALLFGPERAGLENEDVAQANTVVTVPVSPDFAALNLAQSVLLMAYEWGRRQEGVLAPEGEREPPASLIEVEKLAEHYERRLEEAGFFYPEAKAAGMKVTLRN
ncbi:MAG TPA: RNA methyltransferase, partial [Aliiroseovarius sp.]|nr:RNA methyltransferase [Aliiroseovarius sp.]